MCVPYFLKYKPGRLFPSTDFEVGLYSRQAFIQDRRLLSKEQMMLSPKRDIVALATLRQS